MSTEFAPNTPLLPKGSTLPLQFEWAREGSPQGHPRSLLPVSVSYRRQQTEARVRTDRETDRQTDRLSTDGIIKILCVGATGVTRALATDIGCWPGPAAVALSRQLNTVIQSVVVIQLLQRTRTTGGQVKCRRPAATPHLAYSCHSNVSSSIHHHIRAVLSAAPVRAHHTFTNFCSKTLDIRNNRVYRHACCMWTL